MRKLLPKTLLEWLIVSFFVYLIFGDALLVPVRQWQGRRDAEAELAAHGPKLISAGGRSAAWSTQAIAVYREAYGVALDVRAGCCLSRSLAAYYTAYNERMAQAIRIAHPEFDLAAAEAQVYETARARHDAEQAARERRDASADQLAFARLYAAVARSDATSVSGGEPPVSVPFDAVRKDDSQREALARFDEFSRIDVNVFGVVTYLELQELPEDVVQLLPHLPDVRRLRIENVADPHDWPSALRGMRHLREVYVRNCRETDEILRSLPAQDHLWRVRADFCHLGAETARSLGRFPHLRTLSFHHVEFSDEFFAALPASVLLTSLWLTDIPLTNADVRRLEQWPNLKVLYLAPSSRSLTDEVLPVFTSLHRLEELELWNSGISPAGAAWLEDGLPDLFMHYWNE